MVVSLRDRPAALRQVDDVPDAEVASRLPHIFIGRRRLPHTQPEGRDRNERIMQDTFNLGWKLSSSYWGRCAPKLLHTYSRTSAIAKELMTSTASGQMLSGPKIVD